MRAAIGVTAFFRDREPFEVLAKQILPVSFDKRRPEQPVRVWVSGCATGEQAFSIAMCLLERVEDKQLGQRLQIFASLHVQTRVAIRCRTRCETW